MKKQIIHQNSTGKEVMETANQILCWLEANRNISAEIGSASVSLLALANGYIAEERPIPLKLALKVVKDAGYKIFREE